MLCEALRCTPRSLLFAFGRFWLPTCGQWDGAPLVRSLIIEFFINLQQIYGEKDADGFYWGECGKRSGYVPCNMVSEVQVEDERMVQEFLKEERGRGGPGGRLGTGHYQKSKSRKVALKYAHKVIIESFKATLVKELKSSKNRVPIKGVKNGLATSVLEYKVVCIGMLTCV